MLNVAVLVRPHVLLSGHNVMAQTRLVSAPTLGKHMNYHASRLFKLINTVVQVPTAKLLRSSISFLRVAVRQIIFKSYAGHLHGLHPLSIVISSLPHYVRFLLQGLMVVAMV
jgi:hypothetical protein